MAFLLCNQWKFNVPGINAKVNEKVNINFKKTCKNFAVHSPRKDQSINQSINNLYLYILRQKSINRYPD